MLKIATHDSATGEKGMWYCIPLIPFAKTQSKTLQEQYDAGCRLFDLRVKIHRGQWKCAHGIWITKRTAQDIFEQLNTFNDITVNITYEGDADHIEEFKTFLSILKATYLNITWGYSAIKYGKDSKGILTVKYDFLDFGKCPKHENKFLQLDGSSWHTYLPIPWLWKKLYYNNPEFNEETYTIVDFL